MADVSAFFERKASQGTNHSIVVDGRFCAPAPQIHPGLYCCVPCPITDYLYPESFVTWYRIAEGLSIGGVVSCLFLLISFIALPLEKTRRHYLSYCMVVGILFVGLGFVVPLAVRPPQCYDEVTPNDMYSNLTCAFSGAFIIAGGLSMTVWIFVRVLSMHLQIVWDVLPGKKFMYAAQGLGWGIIATLFTVTITLTGVSFRFGDICHVNAQDSVKLFWGPLLGIGCASTAIQLATFAYCIKVYVKNMWSDDATETQSSGGLPSFTTSSIRTKSAKAVYRRVRKVVWLQWRGMTIVAFMLVDVIFLSVVFIYLNQIVGNLSHHMDSILPWTVCLISNPDHREKCFSMGQALFMNMPTIIAVLVLLSLAGLECLLLLGRGSIYTAWWDMVRSKFGSKREFVSLDAKRFSSDARAYELLKIGNTPQIKSPETAVTSPMSGRDIDRDATGTPDYFGKEVQREYRSPTLSFSTPRAPSQATLRVEWDPRNTHARGGLGYHPPVTEDEIERPGMTNKM
ncbi:uncharacterized protein BDZ99DRAFT_100761 [Mytilinidion resinicola]|uniref:G-protein coupled receptors family 2 profile 2 domain-containing protein n=1 Tax=Mytilinidion resinicola TaxID=574789 RepID=A0A6A6YBS7_9PEZI|nr:uncharacterized protein BDZ99DRAFT_100761 [Mytilinidion resinicola]KAF2805963.1 hypothetical protein BDZ99DRAFT_100761 [Mytilinidion resinicola]